MTISVSAAHLAGAKGNYEPQRPNNFSLVIDISESGGTDQIALSIDEADLPKTILEEAELHFGNQVRYVPVKIRHEAGNLVFKDMVDVPIAKSLWSWFKQGGDPQTGKIGYAKDIKKDASILLGGPDGTSERTWQLEGCWLKEFDPGKLDQKNTNDTVMISLVMRFDTAYLA